MGIAAFSLAHQAQKIELGEAKWAGRFSQCQFLHLHVPSTKYGVYQVPGNWYGGGESLLSLIL